MKSTSAVRGIGGVALAVLIVALGACGGSSSSSATSTTARRSSTSTVTPKPAPPTSSSSSTTSAANNCTSANLTVSLIPDPGNPADLRISKTAISDDEKYAWVMAELASGAPSNGLPVLVVCDADNWKFKKGYTAGGMDCSSFTAAERSAVANLAAKTNVAWNCR